MRGAMNAENRLLARPFQGRLAREKWGTLYVDRIVHHSITDNPTISMKFPRYHHFLVYRRADSVQGEHRGSINFIDFVFVFMWL